MEIKEKFLPIGSVVLLKGGEKKVMITGFCSSAVEDQSKVYDYTGCIYPEGYLDFEQICLFDHEQIEKVFFEGYADEEEKEFKEILNEMLEAEVSSEGETESNDTDKEISGGFIIPDLSDDASSTDQLEYL